VEFLAASKELKRPKGCLKPLARLVAALRPLEVSQRRRWRASYPGDVRVLGEPAHIEPKK
jgi:hypothetical protein